MKLKRLFALALVLTLVLGLFAGCSKDDEPAGEQPGQVQQPQESAVPQAKYAYQAKYVPLTGPDGSELNYVNVFCVSGDYIFYVASYVTGTESPTDENGDPILDENTGEPLEYEVYEDGLFRMSLSSGEIKLMEGYVPAEIPEGYEGSSYIQSMLAGLDGTVWLLEETYTYTYDLPENFDESSDDIWNYYVEGESFRTLSQYDAEGRKQSAIKLDLGRDVYLSEMFIDSKGNFYGTDWNSIYVLDSTGAVTATLTPNQGMGQMVQLGPDEIGVITWTENGTVFMPVNAEAKAFGEEITLAGSAYQIYPGTGDYRYMYVDGDSIFGYIEETQTTDKVLSLLDCDVDSNNINQFSFLNDGRIAALERIWSSEGSTNNLIVLEQVDASTIPQKQTLTLACMGLDWQLRPLIVNFNRSHDDVRIVVEDYSEYMNDGTYEDALQKLNTQILSGNVPDLLCLSGLPLEQYAAKGILADLWPLIDGDSELSREQLMTHLFDTMSIDGKLYQATNFFSIQTAAVRSSIAAGRTSWTLEEVLEALEGLETGAGIFGETDTKSGMLTQCLSFNLDGYIDWTTGQCSFNSQEFIDLLNFANSFPAEFDWESYDWETADSEYARLQSGKQLMSTCYISDFQELQVQPALHGGDVTYIGFPATNGSGSCFNLGSTISISSTCSDVDVAWSFVRELLLEENQSEDNVRSFPTNKAAFEARAKEKMTPQYYTDPETGEQVEQSQGGIGYGNDFMIELYATTQEQYDAFMALYENCNSVYSYDDSLMQIILEECEAFFAGQKTAEETTDLIQNRLSLYVAERM